MNQTETGDTWNRVRTKARTKAVFNVRMELNVTPGFLDPLDMRICTYILKLFRGCWA